MNFRILRRFWSKPRMNSVINEFTFEPTYFSQNMNMIVNEKPQLKVNEVHNLNKTTLEKLENMADFPKDPFDMISSDLDLIKTIIFDKILNTEYELLKEVSEYNLKLKGKNFRSWIIMLLSRALYAKHPDSHKILFEDSDFYYTSALLSACIEICHNATLLQDDIIDKAETRRSEAAAYKVYGRSNSVFASNFLISRSSRMLSELDTPHLSQIYSNMVYNLVFGELIQARNYDEDETLKEAVESYISKTYYKTASLMSLAWRGVGIIHNFNEDQQKAAFNFGAHFGIAFQVADDILDFTKSSEELGKPAFNDLKSGLVTAPTIFAFAESNSKELEEMIKRKFKNENDIENTLRIIDQSAGLDNSERLALLHVEDSIAALASHNLVDIDSESYKALVKLTLKVKTRKY